MRGTYRPPSSQISGRVDIGVALEATAYAGEDGLRTAVTFIDMSTARTGFTTVARIDKHHRHASLLCLVADKRPQLSKSPVVLLGPLAFANRHPATNVRQLFEHKRGVRVFRLLDQLLCNTMVDPALKLALDAGHGLESTFRTFGSRALKGLTVGHRSLAHD